MTCGNYPLAVISLAFTVFLFSPLVKADNCAPIIAKMVQQEGAEFVSLSPVEISPS